MLILYPVPRYPLLFPYFLRLLLPLTNMFILSFIPYTFFSTPFIFSYCPSLTPSLSLPNKLTPPYPFPHFLPDTFKPFFYTVHILPRSFTLTRSFPHSLTYISSSLYSLHHLLTASFLHSFLSPSHNSFLSPLLNFLILTTSSFNRFFTPLHTLIPLVTQTTSSLPCFSIPFSLHPIIHS